MANRDLFSTRRDTAALAVNEAGGRAYGLTPRQALAQFAVTGCLGGTFYASARDQLSQALDLARAVASDGEDGARFVAQVAVHARTVAHMKDMPALLLAFLTVDHGALAAQVFDRVIDDAGMLRNFVQILRSGQIGRRSLGTRPRRLVRQWFAQRSDEQLFHGSIGGQPSLGDILKMTHPKPGTAARSALFAWLCDKPYDADALPTCVTAFEHWKQDPTGPLPNLPFRMLTGQPLDTAAWRQIARRATWNQTRINLNTFARHGVFEDLETTQVLAARLADPEQVARAHVFPYSLMTALSNADAKVPQMIKDALERALVHALRNVPELPGEVAIAIDISGSMHSPLTGHRRGATSAVTCLDVAALFTAAIRARNPQAQIVAFHDTAQLVHFPRDLSIAQTARQLRTMPSGGTDCSAAMRLIRKRCPGIDQVIFISDQESWLDAQRAWGGQRVTTTLAEWQRIRDHKPAAKLVCLDLQPYATSQAPTREDILNIGGFSDQVFTVIDRFVREGASADHWVDAIAATAF